MGNQITFFNAPTYNAIGLNGHGTILFNGTSQYGQGATPVLTNPFTIYLVLRQVTWTSNDHLIDNNVGGINIKIRQYSVTPRIKLYDSGGADINTDDLTINTFKVMTIMSTIDDVYLRINLNAILNAVGNNADMDGLTIGARFTPANFSNTEFAYMILRNRIDANFLQENFIRWLKNRFAI